jgi:apolipoprotein N-acyltransferase
MSRKWFLLLASACIYPLPFIFNHYLWWLTFIFLIPLFYSALTYHLSFKEGFVWGFISFTLHEMGIFYSLIRMANGAYIYLTLLSLTLIIYQSLYTGLWFWFTQKISRYVPITQPPLLLTVWVISTWAYITFIDSSLLWVFEKWEGYMLVHPLLPLARIPYLLSLLSFLGKPLLTLIFIASSALLALCLVVKNRFISLAISSIACLPWIISYALADKAHQPPGWLPTIAHIPKSFYNPDDTSKTIAQLTDQIKNTLSSHSDVNLIILPESSLYLCDLPTCCSLLKVLNKDNLGREVALIVGALRKTCNGSYTTSVTHNTAYCISNNTIRQWFDKRHALILTERLPSWARSTTLEALYYTDRPFITPGHNSRMPFYISNTLTLMPYICSELFFNDRPDDLASTVPIIALCNDTWIAAPYIGDLMVLASRFKALQWQRIILYVSYEHALLFDTSGSQWPIKQ